MVALLAEGVDRNKKNLIEKELLDVALLAEGVDRNESEMAKVKRPGVALLAEGVDRNRLRFVRCYSWAGRPPRGGRG